MTNNTSLPSLPLTESESQSENERDSVSVSCAGVHACASSASIWPV